jgi:hypothetical protein
MNSSTEAHPPVLDAPGAGLPKIERILAKVIFGLKRRRTSRQQATALFEDERGRILRLVHSCDAESGTRRVLIKRLRGMEDSSRFWSVFMTLDHLRITNDAFSSVIPALAAGVVPPHKASTAAVKPSADSGIAAVAAFERSCEKFLETTGKIPDLNTVARYAHPWFGTLDAAAWHLVGGFHMGLHRHQLEEILRAARV